MTTDTATNVADLLAEQAEIWAKVEEAAAEEDVGSWLEARMRADALPGLIKQARTAPLRAQLERLEREVDDLVEERGRVMASEPPEPPPQARGAITPQMAKQRLLDGVNRREGNASRERREVLERIAAIEAREGSS